MNSLKHSELTWTFVRMRPAIKYRLNTWLLDLSYTPAVFKKFAHPAEAVSQLEAVVAGTMATSCRKFLAVAALTNCRLPRKGVICSYAAKSYL